MNIGTSKENTVTLRWPTFSRFYWQGGHGGGEGALLLWRLLSHRVSLFGGSKGQGDISLRLLCFLAIRSLPFRHRPIWKEMSNMMTMGHPHSADSQKQALATCQVDTRGHSSEAIETNRINESVHTRKRERVYTL